MRQQKKVKLSDLQRGPIQHATLPAELVARIKAYKKILGDADYVSLADAIDDFRRDRNPEQEVEIWERIVHVFDNFTKGHKITDRARRREVLRILLLLSTASKVYESVTLTREQLIELRYNF